MIQARINKQLHGANGDFQLDANLNIAEGEFVALFGASGVGKTTLLRCLAGLELPEQGNIMVSGETWLNNAARINLPPQRRQPGRIRHDRRVH